MNQLAQSNTARTMLLLTAAALIVFGACVAVGQKRSVNRRRARQMNVPENVEVRRGVVYGTGGGRELKLDLYVPKERSEPCPAVVFMHGGGWRGGNPRQFQRQSLHLAADGYICACIEYRLSGEAQFPAALEDCKCAVRWMRANADELGVDTERICASGGSAGGHLAAMVAMTEPGEFEGDGGNAEQSSGVSLAVLFNPVCDLTGLAQAKAAPAVAQFLGETPAEAPELYEKASPIEHVDEDDPPALILHGTEDPTVPYEQAVAMVEKMQELGIEAELFTAEEAQHGFFNNAPWYEPTLEAMHAFLDKHFRSEE